MVCGTDMTDKYQLFDMINDSVILCYTDNLAEFKGS